MSLLLILGSKIFLLFLRPNFVAHLNYLAHIFLSGDKAGIQTGNFIGDFVKGSKYENFPKHIRKGILLHRSIDHYTDSHPKVKETVEILRPEFGRYSAIIADMYYDHFLAIYFERYSNTSLKRFSYRFYVSVIIRYYFLPEKVRGFIFHFVSTNRLTRYSTVEGLYESLRIMSRYKIKALDPDKAILFLENNRVELEQYFHDFFPDLIRYVDGRLIG